MSCGGTTHVVPAAGQVATTLWISAPFQREFPRLAAILRNAAMRRAGSEWKLVTSRTSFASAAVQELQRQQRARHRVMALVTLPEQEGEATRWDPP